jgi:3-dehydroquinate dehydratase
MLDARKVELSKNKEKITEYAEGNKTKVDNTESSILDIINKLLDRTYYNMTDLEKRLEKIKVKEVRKEERAKDNGTLLISNFRG